jgi:glycolate oxidase FAD binding subunit
LLAEGTLNPGARLTFKANLLPTMTAGLLTRAAARPDRLSLQAHAGNGIVIGHASEGLTADGAAAMLKGLQEAVGEEGNVVVLRCPPAWKKDLPVWGRPRGAWLMRQVKDKLDPRRLFNPGRFIDGI